MSKLIVSVFTERYNYPFYSWNCLHIAIILYQKRPNRKLYKTLVFKPRGLFTPVEVLLFILKTKTENLKRRMTMAKKEYYLYVKGKAVPVSEEVYKAYWKITEHEKYLQRKDWKHNVIPFSALDHDGHFVDNIIDEKIDLEKL